MQPDLDQELEFHLQETVDALVAAGMQPAEARREAERRFGDRARHGRKLSRMARRAHWRTLFADLGSDVRQAVRAFRSTPGFTGVALAVLALGIGASTAIFSVVDAVVLRPLPFAQPDRLVAIGLVHPRLVAQGTSNLGAVTAPDFMDWRRALTSFDALAGFTFDASFILRDTEESERLRVIRTTAGLFDVLRVRPALGRPFDARDEQPGQERVVILSDAFWRKRFGGDRSVIGRTIPFDSGAWQVIGVLPPDINYPVGTTPATDMWAPWIQPEREKVRDMQRFGRNFNMRVVGRVKTGVPVAVASREVETVTNGIAAAFPGWLDGRTGQALSLHEATVGRVRGWMTMLLAGVGFVLLVSCVNVANLMLARAASRSRQLLVRAALGASRWRIARGLLVESLLLSGAGAALGLWLAMWGVRVLSAALPASLPRVAEVAMDWRVLGVTAAVALVTGILFGLAPILQFGSPNVAVALRDAGRSATLGRSRRRVRAGLVVAEVALAVVPVVAAVLFTTSFARVMTVDLGVDLDRLVTVGVSPRTRPDDPKRFEIAQALTRPLVEGVLARARALPGVEAAAATTSGAPLSGSWRTSPATVNGVAFPRDEDQPAVREVTPEYARTLGLRPRAGRFIAATDTAGAPLVIVLNAEAARRFLGDANPIGATVTIDDETRTVVGVVGDVRVRGPEVAPQPEVYVPMAQTRGSGATVVVRVAPSVDVQGVADAVAREVRALNPGVPVRASVASAELATLVAQRRLNMLLTGLFGVLAVVIASAGVYGVMACIVADDTREYGIRLALGASPRTLLRHVFQRAVGLVGAGLVAGLGLAWVLAGSVEVFLFEVEPRDPALYGVVAAVLAFSGIVAALVPARRAASVNPKIALEG